jgi:hypothetical protein
LLLVRSLLLVIRLVHGVSRSSAPPPSVVLRLPSRLLTLEGAVLLCLEAVELVVAAHGPSPADVKANSLRKVAMA